MLSLSKILFNLGGDSSKMRFRCKHFLHPKQNIKMPKKHRDTLFLRLFYLWMLCAILGAHPAYALESAPKDEENSKPATEQTVEYANIQNGTAGSFLSSQFARQSGDVDAAILYLAHALEKNPDNMGLASQLLSMQVSRGDMASALATATSLQKKDAHDPLAELLTVVSMVKKMDYDAASKKLSDAFDEANGQLWLPLLDAWVDAGKGKIKKPLSIEEMPVTVGRAAGVMNYHLALINEYAGFSNEAATNFTDAIEEPESASLRMMQQLHYFSAKHPEYPALKDLLGRYAASHPEPLRPLESVIGSPVEGIAEVLYTMGNVMQMAGVRQDATIYLQMARYLRPDFHLAKLSLSEIFSEASSYQRASDILKTIPDSSQYALKASLRHAMILDRMGNTPAAMALLDALAAKNPKQPDPLTAKGDLLRVHQRFLEATIAYSDAITRAGEPSAKEWAVFYARGACLERLDRWSEAKADLRKSLELNPDQPDVLNYLGYGMITRGESPEEAKAMLEKAIAANPNDPQIIDSMGWALFVLGEYEAARPYLERAVELLPGDATVNDHLGDIYWRLDRKHEARFQWQRALTFLTEETEMKKINAKLASGLPQAAPLHNATKSASATAAPANIH